MKTEMTSNFAVELIQWLASTGISLHVDGGWAVDALIGEQTRTHADLDIAIEHKDVTKLRALLESRGYREIPWGDTWECNFVLADDSGHMVDVHSYTFDEDGNHIYGCEYPYESLSGRGSINDYDVDCIAPEWLVKFHSGYELQEKDFHDVSALCSKFGIDLPSEFDRFLNEDAESKKV
jgi:lincosamide nucleotidyltransferase A/C/D/E